MNSVHSVLFLLLICSTGVVSTSVPLLVYWSPTHNDNAVVATQASISSLDNTYSFVDYDLYIPSNSSTSPGAGYIPLNFYFNSKTNHHMLTASATGNAFALANGFTFKNIEGWVYAVGNQVEGSRPLYMYYSTERDDHFLCGGQTDQDNARGAGYTIQYIDSYTPPPPPQWTVWPNTPPNSIPFPQSTDLIDFEYNLGFNAVPPGIGADTWYPSWAADGNLYSSWTDGTVNGVRSSSTGETSATTGYATIIGDDPFNLTVVNVATYNEGAGPYQGRYPSLNFYLNNTWFYGTYSLENYGKWPSPPPDCGNWCYLCPFTSIRISNDKGNTWIDSRRTMTSYTDNLFGETCVNNTKVKIGAPHAVDFGQENMHSPDGRLYMISTGAEDPDSYESWMQGSSIYLSRTIASPPDPLTINTAAAWEFYNTQTSTWVTSISDSSPLFVWPNRTGVVTMSFHPTLQKYIVVISTPTDGNSMVKDFDTYFLECDTMFGPFKLISYITSFGPEAYFVHIPGKFMGGETYESNGPVLKARNIRVPRGESVTEPLSRNDQIDSASYYNFFLSYSADFASGSPNPPGSGYHWSLQQSRFSLSAQFAAKLKKNTMKKKNDNNL
jgi:hypothetical protein